MHPRCACHPVTEKRVEAERWLKGAGGGELDGVVAKRLDEPYRPGERAMVKVKCLRTADCVVVGYNVDKSTGQVTELVLASVVDEKLQYVGTVSGNIPPEIEQQLQKKLPVLEQEQPFLKCPVAAKWVKPVVTCRASFKSWSENKRMQEPVFKELLADTDSK